MANNYIHSIGVEITEAGADAIPAVVMAENLKSVKVALSDMVESGYFAQRNRAHLNNAIERVEKVRATVDIYAADVAENAQRKAIKSKVADATPEQLEKIAAILG